MTSRDYLRRPRRSVLLLPTRMGQLRTLEYASLCAHLAWHQPAIHAHPCLQSIHAYPGLHPAGRCTLRACDLGEHDRPVPGIRGRSFHAIARYRPQPARRAVGREERHSRRRYCPDRNALPGIPCARWCAFRVRRICNAGRPSLSHHQSGAGSTVHTGLTITREGFRRSGRR